MSIFHKVALQSLKKSRTRTVVTVIGVVLSAALFTAVSTFGVSLLHYLTEGAIQKYGDWHVAFLDVDASFVQEQTGSGEVTGTAEFENIGYARLDGGRDAAKPYLFIAGYSEKTFDALPVTLLSGRMPVNSGEILVSGSIATKGGVACKVGDTLSLAVGDRRKGEEKLSQADPYCAGEETLVMKEERTYTVVGICRTPAFEEDAAPGYTLITVSDAADTAEPRSLFVTLKNPRRVHAYADSAAGGHACLFNDNVLRFMGLSEDAGDNILTALLYAAGVIVAAIIMTGSVFLIYNSFHISLNERTQQFGILASVGATAKQLQNSVLFEGLCIGAIGIPIGILLGLGGIGLVIAVVARSFGNILYSDVPLTLQVSAPAIAGAAAVSLVTILLSAYIPARKAAKTPVMECIRQTNEVKLESGAVKTSKLAQRIYGLEGTLARKNFKRNRKRCRSIVLSLVLSIVLFVSTNAFVINLKQLSGQAKAVTDYDISFGTQDMEDSEMLRLYDRLKTAAGVSGSSYQFVLEYTCRIPSEALSDAYWKAAGAHTPEETVDLPMAIQFLDDGSFLNLIRGLGLPEEEYAGENAKLLTVAKMEDNSSQVENVNQLSDLFTSSSLHVTLIPTAGGRPNTAKAQNAQITNVTFVPPDIPPVTGTFQQQPYFLQIIAPCSLMEKLAPAGETADVRVKGLMFQSEDPSRSAAEMERMIQDFGVTVPYLFLNTANALAENRNYIFIANVFAYTFIIMISLIAAANVFNTISTDIRLRRRELAMLRSVGMSERAFNKMMRFECAFYGMRALLFGLPLAAVFSWLIYKGMFAGGAEGIRFILPWAGIGISTGSVLLVIFVTMMYAVSKIRKENIIDALRDDMT